MTISTEELTPGQRRTAAARAARAAAALSKMAERLEGAGYVVVHPNQALLLDTVVEGYLSSRPPGMTREDVLRALRGDFTVDDVARWTGVPAAALVPLFSDGS